MKTLASLFLFCFLYFSLSAQSSTQTIKVTVTDKDSHQPLIGATISIEGIEPMMGTTTDLDGNFRLDQVPVGRHTLRCQYVGYASFVSDNVIIKSH